MEVGVFEARNRFSELVEAAERGEEVVVLRRGKPAVRIVSAAAVEDRVARGLAAVEEAAALRASFRGPVGTAAETRADRDRGRKY
jgi:prevent-host-death family protein